MSRIERDYCLISASHLAGLFDIFILLHIWQICVCFDDILPMRTLCDAYTCKSFWPPNVIFSTQVQLASTCDYMSVRLARA